MLPCISRACTFRSYQFHLDPQIRQYNDSPRCSPGRSETLFSQDNQSMQYLQMWRLAISTAHCSMGISVMTSKQTPARWSKYLPCSHKMQTCVPEKLLYFPISQDEQAPPSTPAYPGTHLQSAMSELPAGASEKGVHVKQNDIPEALA